MEEKPDFSVGNADQFPKTWAEVGTQMLKNWFDLMEVTVGNPPAKGKPEPESIPQPVVDYQQLQFHLLKLAFDTWQEMLPGIESGEDGQNSLNYYRQKLRDHTQKFSAGTLKSCLEPTALWQTYLKEMQALNQLWVTALGVSIDPTNPTSATRISKSWIELNSSYWNLAFEKIPGNLAQMPLLGPNRDLSHKLMQASDAWAKLYPASMDYQMVLAKIQIQSFEELLPELISLAKTGETVKNWQQFQQLWGRIVDKVFEQAFCLEENLKVRGKFLNAINHYKLCQQELTEIWMKSMNLPTRSEIDEVHQSIYELRKQVKHLKKNLTQLEAQAQTTPQKTDELGKDHVALSDHAELSGYSQSPPCDRQKNGQRDGAFEQPARGQY
ncbi:MAG: class III poly(R)-hydroxyalkanoic acid synthase subunit PhaE [Microcoleaceae cyanobacterium]